MFMEDSQSQSSWEMDEFKLIYVANSTVLLVQDYNLIVNI